MPLDGLDVGASTAPDIGEEQATEGISSLVGAVRVHLSSIVGCGNVDQSLVDKTRDYIPCQYITYIVTVDSPWM